MSAVMTVRKIVERSFPRIIPPENGRIRLFCYHHKMSSGISSFFTSIFPVVHADSEERPTEAKQQEPEEPETEAPAAEEEEEPEDVSSFLSSFESSG